MAAPEGDPRVAWATERGRLSIFGVSAEVLELPVDLLKNECKEMCEQGNLLQMEAGGFRTP